MLGIVPTSPAPTQTPSNGYTPLTIQCHTCHSVFRFHRTEHSSHTPPTYCVFCGSLSISSNQDGDLDYIESIASVYGVTPKVMRALLDVFQHQNGYHHFSDFMVALKSEVKAL